MAVLGERPVFRPANRAKAMFFDRDKVLRAVDRSERKNLNWLGGYIRKVARNSLRPRKEISKPGDPPATHATYRRPPKPPKPGQHPKPGAAAAKPKRGSSFRDSVLYSFDPDARAVVAGPVLFALGRRTPTVPELLEVGGSVPVKRGGATFAARYRPRPFMRPALAVSLPKFFERLKGSVQ